MNSRDHARINKRYLIELKGGKCHDCGGVFPPCCFHFDHRDVTAKLFNLSDRMHWDLGRIKDEFEKCDLVCANCHALRTFIHKREGITKKQGDAQRGKTFSHKARTAMAEAQKGHRLSAESRAKLSASRMGQVNTPPGWNHTEEAREKMSKIAVIRFQNNPHPRQGAHLTEETKRKISASLMGKPTGRRPSPEGIEKIRAAQHRRWGT